MCGECSQWVDHIGFATAQGSMYFPDLHCSGSQVALQGHCPKWALCLMQFPGLSRSGFWVFCRGTDPDGLCILCPSQVQPLRQPGAWRAHCPRRSLCLNHLPGPSRSVSWVHHKSAVTGVLCVSSGELISGCDTPGKCQPSRIPRRRGYQLATCSQFGGRCGLWD